MGSGAKHPCKLEVLRAKFSDHMDDLMTESIEFPMTGETRNFRFFVQNTVGAAGVAVTDLLQQNCEVDLNKLIGIFNKGLPPELPFKIVIDESDDGASHSGCSETEIHIGFNKTLRSKFSPGKMASIYRLLLVAEVVEVFEAMMREWNCGFAPGEGLSRVLALYVVPAGEFNSTSADWLATKPLQNWVAQIDPSDQNP